MPAKAGIHAKPMQSAPSSPCAPGTLDTVLSLSKDGCVAWVDAAGFDKLTTTELR
jgi:hypothetical protein